MWQNDKKMTIESMISEEDLARSLPEARGPVIPCPARCALPAVPGGVSVACYRITLSFPLGLALSGFASFVLHGVLGASLRDVSPRCYATLYGDQDIIHPWLITGFRNESLPGGQATFELRLFNDATSFLPDLVGALMLAGCTGLGPQRFPFDVIAVEVLLPGGDPQHSLDLATGGGPLPFPLTSWCHEATAEAPIRVSFESPAALKAGNDIVRTQPSFELLISRLLARLSLLARMRVLDAPQKQHLLSAAGAVKELRSSVRWHEEQRYSGRQRRTMPFGGLMGEMVYEASAASFAPWLDAATLLGIGGKTTFGFGQVRWCHEI